MNTPKDSTGGCCPSPPCSASWPQGFSVTIGSRWQTKETPRLRGALFAADVTANSVSLQLEETEDFRGGLARKLAWVSAAQDLAEKWECLPNDQGQQRAGKT